MDEAQRDDCYEVTEKYLEGGGEGRGGGRGDGSGGVKEDEKIRGAEEDHCENDDTLKRSISNHPLYGKLVEVHLNCLRVGGACKDDMTPQTMMIPQVNRRQHQNGEAKLSMPSQPDLDLFMETCCLGLSKLREAMEEPQLEAMAFIDDMHSQLEDMIPAPPPPLPSTSSVSGETNA